MKNHQESFSVLVSWSIYDFQFFFSFCSFLYLCLNNCKKIKGDIYPEAEKKTSSPQEICIPFWQKVLKVMFARIFLHCNTHTGIIVCKKKSLNIWKDCKICYFFTFLSKRRARTNFRQMAGKNIFIGKQNFFSKKSSPTA